MDNLQFAVGGAETRNPQTNSQQQLVPTQSNPQSSGNASGNDLTRLSTSGLSVAPTCTRDCSLIVPRQTATQQPATTVSVGLIAIWIAITALTILLIALVLRWLARRAVFLEEPEEVQQELSEELGIELPNQKTSSPTPAKKRPKRKKRY